MAIVKKKRIVTQNSPTEALFADIYSNLNVHPNKLDLVLHYDEDSVKRSIRNILLTDRGERFFNPLFGSSIKAMLFENMTPQTPGQLKEYITMAIQNFEPRANLLNVYVQALPDDNAYATTIIFSIINKTEPITLELLLNRIR